MPKRVYLIIVLGLMSGLIFAWSANTKTPPNGQSFQVFYSNNVHGETEPCG